MADMIEDNGRGHLHPLSQIIVRATEVFRALGFSVVSGPEMEEEFYNFDALNIPADHPARGMQDTFWLKPSRQAGGQKREVLRTHTTAVDTRYLKEHEPPFRIVAPGRVFRNEATDATHEAQFYQLDGLVVEENVSLANLKWLLEHFYRSIFGAGLEFRWRPSYFSFVEPGLELDIKWGERWLEVVGCGMLHPNVFKAAGRDPKKWRGLAFGSTVDRLAMLKYGITDIRQLYQGDTRFLGQF
jgi:phenylalanyl-tRNA synthetase alpha chain